MKTVIFLIFKFLLTIQVIIVIFEIFHNKDVGVEKYKAFRYISWIICQHQETPKHPPEPFPRNQASG